MAHKEQSLPTIAEAYNALARFVVFGARGQPPEWPFSIIETNWYHARFFAKEVYALLCDLDAAGVSQRQVQQLCWGPSAVTHWLYILEPALGLGNTRPFDGLSAPQAHDFMTRTLSLLASQRTGDPLCRDMRNLTLTDAEASGLLQKSVFLPTADEPELRRLISILNVTLWHYCILIQIGHRAYSQEFHGPYAVGGTRQMFVRDFLNLRADAVWPFSAGMPERIRVVEIYNGGKIEVDMFNHFAISPEARLVDAAVSVEGHNIQDMTDLRMLYERCEWLLSNANGYVASFGKKDWVKKVVQMRYHWLQPHASVLRRRLVAGPEVLTLENNVAEAEKAAVAFGRTLGQSVAGLSGEALIEKAASLFVGCLGRE